jgi:hypothetical protein
MIRHPSPFNIGLNPLSTSGRKGCEKTERAKKLCLPAGTKNSLDLADLFDADFRVFRPVGIERSEIGGTQLAQ